MRRYVEPEWGHLGNRGYRSWLNEMIPTCRMTVEEHPEDSPFQESHGPIVPENKGMEHTRVGGQRGTYFKTSLVRHHPVWGEMTVWYYGQVHPVDLANGVRA